MAFDLIKAEIDELLSDLQRKPDDARELQIVLLEKLNELRAFGMPVPSDLIKLEAALAADLARGDEAVPDEAVPE